MNKNKKLQLLSDAFQENSLKMMNTTRDPKIGLLRTYFMVAKYNLDEDNIARELRLELIKSNSENFGLLSGSRFASFPEDCFQKALKDAGLNTDKLDRVVDALDEEIMNIEIRELSEDLNNLNIVPRVIKMIKSLKKMGMV